MAMASTLSSSSVTRLANKDPTSLFQRRPSLSYATTSTVSYFSTSTSGSQNLIMFSPSRSEIVTASAISDYPGDSPLPYRLSFSCPQGYINGVSQFSVIYIFVGVCYADLHTFDSLFEFFVNCVGVESSVIGEDSASMLESVQVFDLDGNGIQISDLWKDRKAVVAFARHFGCVLCRKRADYLATKKDRMDAAGVALVLIGPGSVEQARAFSEQTKFKGEVYADPNHSSYEALKFVSGVSVTFTSKAALKIMKSYMEGYRQDWGLSFEKDTVRKGGWQQGGIIVAGPGKSNISYIHKDKEAGDDPDIEVVLKSCCS